MAGAYDDALTKGGLDAYVDEMISLLDGRDPLQVQRATSARLRELTSDLTGAELARPEAPGKWWVRDVAQHLADAELVNAYRMRRILAEPGSPVRGYDQDSWLTEIHRGDDDLGATLVLFDALRIANLRLLSGLDPNSLAREGMHTERGPESLARMLSLYAAHDLVHLAQIERIRRAIRA